VGPQRGVGAVLSALEWVPTVIALVVVAGLVLL
jgi:membrane protein required for beta-lactamase induction